MVQDGRIDLPIAVSKKKITIVNVIPGEVAHDRDPAHP